MKSTTTDRKEYTKADMCVCSEMNTAGYCDKCNPMPMIDSGITIYSGDCLVMIVMEKKRRNNL